MKVIVDTSIWSLVLRRNIRKHKKEREQNKLLQVIDDGRIIMLGPIRQELLSGIPDKNNFDMLKKYLNPFIDFPLKTEDYELAAEFFNICRAKGVQGSNTDFLISAVAVKNKFSIYTNDKDFELFKKHIPIQLES